VWCFKRRHLSTLFFTSDSRPEIAKINKATLIVGATKDLVPQFQEMQKRIPGARFELFEDAGHALLSMTPISSTICSMSS
jgi:pimeloyl-ACP methyl ester carboxylesterase